MKVNIRNLIELILQIITIPLFFYEDFYFQPRIVIISDAVTSIGFTCFEFMGQFSVLYSAIFFLTVICSVVLLAVQLVSQKRNLLIVHIIILIETVLLIFIYIWAKIEFTMISCTVLILLVVLSAISFSGYIKAKKKGITDEPLIKAKQVEISSDYDELCYGEEYRNLALFVFLYIITFGIWNYVWVYKTTKFLNKTPNAEVYSPAKKLLLCIFVPLYQTYWFYKHGEKIDALSQYEELKNNYLTILCPLIPIPLISSVIMQDKINQVCTHK